MSDGVESRERASSSDALEQMYLAYGKVAEEVQASLRAGRQPDVEALTARYSRIAGEIRELVSALVMLEGMQSAQTVDIGVPGASHLGGMAEGRIGDFRIVREIGRGGMGVVYEAEQISLQRRVALKVLPLASVVDPKHLQRFKNEAHAAAHLNHRNIVPVYAVGSDQGLHYYAMQLVEGCTLTDVIVELRELEQEAGKRARTHTHTRTRTQTRGSTRAQTPAHSRVPTGSSSTLTALAPGHSTSGSSFFRSVARLGLDVASGLQHAHELGVVHRDIKPSNLLLDQGGNVWIADFGLARLESDPGVTLSGELVGTLRYMSPEQAAARPVVLDHRTDIYSLGVTLYELLTLTPAFQGGSRQELLHRIATLDPPRPRKVNPAVPIDLETIVLKAMSKEPGGRYQQAVEMGRDLERFLEHRPVLARRPSLMDWLVKWSRRHRYLVASAVLILALAVVGLAVGTVLIWREQARTTSALSDAEYLRGRADVARQQAEQERALATAVYEFMHGTLTGFSRSGPDVTLREVLDDAAETIDGQFPGQPLVEAEVRNMIQAMYGRLGEYELAEPHAREMLEIRLRELGPRDPETLEARCRLAGLLLWAGRPADAWPLYEDVLAARGLVLGPGDRATLYALNSLAIDLRSCGWPQKAEPVARWALEASREALGDEDETTVEDRVTVARILSELGRHEEAGRLYAEVLRALRAGGQASDKLIQAISNMAWHHFHMDDPVAAEPLFQEALDLSVEFYGDCHLEAAKAAEGLAEALVHQGRSAAGEALLEKTLDRIRARHGEAHEATLLAMKNLADILHHAKDQETQERVVPLLREIVRIRHTLGVGGDRAAAESCVELADHLRQQGDLIGAREALESALEHYRAGGDAHHPDALGASSKYVGLLAALGEPARAIEVGEELVEACRRVFGENARETADEMNRLSVLYADSGAPEKAVPLCRKALQADLLLFGAADPRTLSALTNLAAGLWWTGKGEEAIAILEDAIPSAEEALGEAARPRQLRLLQFMLANYLQATQRFEDAETLLRGALEESSPGEEAADERLELLERLAVLHERWESAAPGKGHAEKARAYREELEALRASAHENH